MRRAADFQGLQPVIATDAVLDMNHVITIFEARHLTQEFLALAPPTARPRQALT